MRGSVPWVFERWTLIHFNYMGAGPARVEGKVSAFACALAPGGPPPCPSPGLCRAVLTPKCCVLLGLSGRVQASQLRTSRTCFSQAPGSPS